MNTLNPYADLDHLVQSEAPTAQDLERMTAHITAYKAKHGPLPSKAPAPHKP